MISAFTPTHNPQHLRELYTSLLAQTYDDWEWVVVPNGDNGGAAAHVARALAGDDTRVRIIPAPPGLSGIGALKRFACDQAKGDYFAEVDHDDTLTENCFEKVMEVATPFSFVYSDDVTIDRAGTCIRFTPDFGWRHYDWVYKGKKYLVNKHCDPHPRMLCQILFAPDHIRVWSRAAYEISGGHDPNLSVGDDHDLIVRTYLKGVEFHYIPEPLYFHIVSHESTSRQQSQLITEISEATCAKQLAPLVSEWCRRKGLPMLDLGGAFNCPPGYDPVDYNLPLASAYSGDVFEVLGSLPDKSVGVFRAHDFLEHVQISQVVVLMNMIYQKLVPGGFLLSHTPAVCDNAGRTGRGAFQDPTHVSYWSSNNTWYYTDREKAKYVPGIKCRFQNIILQNHYPSDWHKHHLIPYLWWDAMSLRDDDVNYFPGPRHI
jgi:glycosyltransferase involved in cell wall biosynthesis